MWLMGEERRKNKVSNNTINVAHNISLKWNLVEVWGNIMYLKTEIPHMPQTAAHMFKPAYRPIASVCLPSSTFTPVSAQLFWVKMPFSCSCNQQRQREREREREREGAPVQVGRLLVKKVIIMFLSGLWATCQILRWSGRRRVRTGWFSAALSSALIGPELLRRCMLEHVWDWNVGCSESKLKKKNSTWTTYNRISEQVDSSCKDREGENTYIHFSSYLVLL